MKSKINKEEYRKHHFPLGLFLGYLVSTVGGCFLVDYLSVVLFESDLTGIGMTIISDILSFFIMILILGVWLLVFLLPSFIFGYRKTKIYRGISFYKFINFVTVILILFYFINLIFLHLGDIGVIFTCAGPVIARFVWYDRIVRKCSGCGLINSLQFDGGTTTHISTRYEFYNYGTEGYAYAKKRRNDTYKCTVCGTFDYHSYETETQV